MAKRDVALAAQQSPTTNRFFTLSELMDGASKTHHEFVAAIVSFTGIKAKPKKAGRAK